MQLAKVVGTVVASQKSERVDGLKMMILRPMGPDGTLSSSYLVAFDSVGAGEGEVVLYATGSSARLTAATQNRPADAVIMAIVDTIELDGALTYQKADDA